MADGSQFTPFMPVPWPSWIGEPEPEWIKDMPGGCVTFGTLAIMLIACIGMILVSLIKWYCVQTSVSVGHRAAARAIKAKGIDEFAAQGCVGPKLVMVLRERQEASYNKCTPLLCPESMVRRELLQLLDNSRTLVAVPIAFDAGTALSGREVWVLGIKPQDLGTCAEEFNMLKLVDNGTIINNWRGWKGRISHVTNAKVPPCLSMDESTEFQKDLFEQEFNRLQDRLADKTKMFNTWRPYSERKKSMFVKAAVPRGHQGLGCYPCRRKAQGPHEDKSIGERWSDIWTLNDVMTIMLGIIGRERSPGKYGKGGYPVFLAAWEVGEIESIFPLVDAPEDRREIMDVLRSWNTRAFWREPPLENVMKVFGPSTAIYFSFVQTYAVWILVPAVFAVLSLIWHYMYHGIGYRWGAAPSEGWSQALTILFLSGWSSIFFCAWTRQCAILNFRLGQDASAGDTYGLDGSTLYFRNRGYKVKRKRNVDLKEKTFCMGFLSFDPTQKNPLIRSILMIMILLLFLGFTIGTIAGLCWISDKASKIGYFKTNATDNSTDNSMDNSTGTGGGGSGPYEKENFFMQNLMSVACYFVISIPLEKIYNRMTRFLTEIENLKNHSAFVEKVVRRRALFQLVNSQGWFLYLAFVAQDIRSLRWQLTVFFIFKPSGLLGTFVEFLQHFGGKCCRFCKNRCKQVPEDPFEKEKVEENILQEYKKAEPDLFDEYLEVTILFSAVLCFAPVFPEGLLVAFLHTCFEYFTDKNKLFLHLRLKLPKRSDLFAIKAWITVWQGIGWVGIVASTWLTHIFMVYIHHENTADWDPEDWRAGVDLTSWGGNIAWVRIVLLEHILLFFKAYLAVAVQVESDDIMQHKEVVDRIFADEDSHPDKDHDKDKDETEKDAELDTNEVVGNLELVVQEDDKAETENNEIQSADTEASRSRE